jgi:hypothetical protein
MTPNPYAPPAPADVAPDRVHVAGTTLVVGRTAVLPDVCVKCGQEPPTPIVRVQMTYDWAPLWARFFWGFGLTFFRRRAVVDLPVCASCWGRRQSAARVMSLTVAGVVFLELVGFWNVPRGGGALAAVIMFAIVLLGVVIPVAVSIAFARPRRLPMVVRIDADAVTLREVAPKALEAIRRDRKNHNPVRSEKP